MTTGKKFEALIEIMDQLRDPGGCPWDQKQTMESLQPYLIEEPMSASTLWSEVSARNNAMSLGDLLLQIEPEPACSRRGQLHDRRCHSSHHR